MEGACRKTLVGSLLDLSTGCTCPFHGPQHLLLSLPSPQNLSLVRTEKAIKRPTWYEDFVTSTIQRSHICQIKHKFQWKWHKQQYLKKLMQMKGKSFHVLINYITRCDESRFNVETNPEQIKVLRVWLLIVHSDTTRLMQHNISISLW